jgi:hypothetical protein
VKTHKCSPIHLDGKAPLIHIFTCPLSPNGRKASSIYSLFDMARLELALHFFFLHNDDVFKLTVDAHMILFFFRT